MGEFTAADIVPLLVSTGFLKYPLEMNAKMEISKNQWTSTGGVGGSKKVHKCADVIYG